MTTPNHTRLRNVRGIGPKRYASILARLDETGATLDELFRMTSETIKADFRIPINVAKEIAKAPEPDLEKSESDLLAEKGVKVLKRGTENYPKRLEALLGDKAPPILYVWGNLELLEKPAVGFCGSRNVTEKGLEVAAETAQQITELGWVIVSGHARGVDAKAHKTALEYGGGTIIVAPQGIVDFKLRRELKEIAKPEQILIISEFPPKARWNVGYAMARNKTIIGLADALILVEARSKGGTFEAGQTALRLKAPLFVAHYETSTESSAGNEYFLRRGAVRLGRSSQTGKANIENLRQAVNSKRTKDIANGSTEKDNDTVHQLPLLEIDPT